MELQELIVQITDYGFKEDFYRFTLFLPIKMLGSGRKYELYNSVYDDGKPWTNEDCFVPVKHVDGALIINTDGEMVEISFLVKLEKLWPFAESLWEALADFNYDVKVKIEDDVTVGDET